MTVTEEGFALREIRMELPLTKVFPEDEPDDDAEDDADSRTFIAHDAAGDLAGFVTVAVVPQHRGRGVGRALVGLARKFAIEPTPGGTDEERSPSPGARTTASRQAGVCVRGHGPLTPPRVRVRMEGRGGAPSEGRAKE
ncbi:GNAT family N-acetyltransferase [Streptomyces capillispiralis]|uniref:GNAT family N-acetyltransferase n=1 Tax=Streptomyces capillispiralis TaxID=68182 RepID=UPI001675A724|nr:GNAT family N-acetyltransferase [Streptomyces capillispiralis]GHH95744.1 hypothetical protein GCM10017779_62010 [Streptomyces capillispiralis]